MNHGFKLNDNEFDIGLSRARDGYRLHIDGRVVEVDLRPAEGGGWLLQSPYGVDHVTAAVHGDDVFLHLDGATYHLQYEHPLQRLAELAEAAGGDTVAATMPGSMIALEVETGQKVETGQILVVIESMKMETTFTAPRDGIVQAIHVGVGESFDKGAALVTLEPEE